jgi:hypothetical protein
MRTKIILFLTRLLGIYGLVKPLVKDGLKAYKEIRKEYQKANSDGVITAQERKEIAKKIIEQSPEVVNALIDFWEKKFHK